MSTGHDPSAEAAAPASADATDAAPPAAHDDHPMAERGEAPIDVETLVSTLEAVTVERDSHLEDLQRVSAEFANFRRQATRRQTETIEQAASGLAEKLLPVLDACEAAQLQGASDIAPIHSMLVEILRKEGLDVVRAAGVLFDPERHEAVMHEAGDGGEPTVAEVLRAGYVWNGRVLRPAMVRVKG